MTTKAKKPAKTSRDNLDLDLDARLDQATSTLSLDEEPVVGDALDQVLANAKKELDAVLPESDDILDLGNDFDLPEMGNLDSENEAEKTIPFQSESLASLESQLTAAMETPIISDDELDNLLGGTGYDFDSLLGDADDELTPDEAQLNEDSLLAAVDELLNFGFDLEPEVEAVVEPEVVEIEPEVEAVVEPEVVEIEPEVEAVVEPEVIEIEPEVEAVVEPEVVEIEPEVEAVVEPEVVEIEPEVEAVVEPEVVEIEPEVEAVVEPEVVEIESKIESKIEAVVEPEVVEIEPEVEAVVEPEVVEIEPEVEAVVEPEVVEIEPEVEAVVEPEVVEIESRVDDVDSELVELESDLNFEFESDGFLEPEVVAQDTVEMEESEMAIEDETTDFSLPTEIELTVEPEAALDDLVDSVPFEDTLKIDANDAESEDVFIEEFNDFDNVADIVAPLVEISLPTDDELDVAQQLDGLNDAMENKNETTAGFDLLDDDAAEKEQATPVTNSTDDDMDWMKQLDNLDAADTAETVAPVALEKTDVEPETADNDDWMKQLDDLDAADTAETVAPVALEKADVEPEMADDDDWMKQLDDLDAADTAETVAPVALEKTDVEPEMADDDDWMKQLDDLDAADTAETVAPVALEKADVEPEMADDDDWMKQLDDLGTEESPAEVATDDDDWMKQLDDANEQDHTAMSHDTTESIDDNFNIADAEPQHFNAAIDENALIAKAAEAAVSQFKENQDHVVSQLRADQDSIESKTRKQFAEAENSRKKSATFGYAALGVGIIGLLGSGAIGYFSYGTKTEADTLTQSVTALEEKVNAIVAKDPEKEKEIANIKTSVEQLNQKVEKLVAAQVAPVVPPVATAPVEAGKTPVNGKIEPAKGTAVNLLNSKTPAVPASTGAPVIDTPKIAETELVPPVDISPAHPVGEHKAELKLSEMVKKPTDDAKAKAEKAVKAEAEKAKEKADAALLTEKLAKATAVAKAAAATTKTDEQRKLLTETRASRYAGKMTRGMARGAEKERTENSKVATTKTEARRAAVEAKTKEILNTAVKPQKAAPTGKYSVNVVSYQQEWFAQSKAAEFRQKGIPVEVAPVDPNNYSTKYRLKVGGFKTKADADAYAAKIKKSHGVNDTWTAAN